MELIKPDVNIDFVGKRKLAYVISGLLVLLTVVSLFMRGGLNLGIDFAGGILVQVRFEKPTDPAAIKKALTPLGMQDSLVQSFGGEKNEFLIRAERPDLKLEGLADRVREVFKKNYGEGFEVRRVEMVGPKVGADLREKALLAIFYALLLIAVYISGRFEMKWVLAAVMAGVLVGATLLVEGFVSSSGGSDGGGGTVILIVTALVVTVVACAALKLRYALGAIVALIHDVVITVGVFSILDKEFTLAIVAAVLTIIGYSLNDTIIVFDRIRENLRKGGRKEFGEIINDSVNQTLSRTILTSGTTLLVLISLYVLGGGVIQDFALALLVGVVVGTYSSIFVASPILLALPEGKPSLALKPRQETTKPIRAARVKSPAKVKDPGQVAQAKTDDEDAAAKRRAKKKAGKKKKKR